LIIISRLQAGFVLALLFCALFKGARVKRRQQCRRNADGGKAKNPRRWSGDIRNFSLPESVTLNPEKAANC